jgi:hypothetical protein
MYRLMLVAAAGLLLSAGSALACSPAELVQKQKAFAEATKAAYARDPAGDEARRARMQAVIARYADLQNSRDGGYVIKMICKEHDELLEIYK